MRRSPSALPRVTQLALTLTLATACAVKAPTSAGPPLPERPFTMPDVAQATLSNGLVVKVAQRSTVPLFSMTLAVRAGGFLDPEGQEGLASATWSMLDKGTTTHSATDISRLVRATGGSLSTGANNSYAYASVSGPTRNLDALVELWADVLLNPAFPEDEWDMFRARRLAGLRAAAENPTAIASKVASRILWGDSPFGRATTEASTAATSISDLRSFHSTYTAPNNAVLFVGGDVDLNALVPKLEAALAGWEPGASPERPSPEPQTFQAATMYVVDKPGAAQSVVRTILPMGPHGAEDHFALDLGTTAIGGAFTARLNMNLREDKGYTYGARCGISYGYGPGVFECSTSVNTPVTGPALAETRAELTDPLSSRPITEDEIAYFRGYRSGSFQLGFETPDQLLARWREIWVYDRPAGWLTQQVPGWQSVTLAEAQQAYSRWFDPSRLAWLVVGDLSQIGDDLIDFGLPVVHLDRDGLPLENP